MGNDALGQLVDAGWQNSKRPVPLTYGYIPPPKSAILPGQRQPEKETISRRNNGYYQPSKVYEETDELEKQIGFYGNKQKQQLMQRDEKDLKKQQKHKELQRLTADTYCRLLAQIEAIFKKLKVYVHARHAEFDLNPASSDLQDLLMGVEGFLNSLRIYNISVQKQQLDPLQYPAAQASIAEFKRALTQIEPRNRTTKRVMAWVIQCLENNSFLSEIPETLSQAIMNDTEKAQHLDVRTTEGRTRMLGLQSDALQLNGIVDNKLKQAVKKPYDPFEKPVPLVTDYEIHNVRTRHYRQENLFW